MATDSTTPTKVYTINLAFTQLAQGNSVIVDFAQTSRDFRWEMSGNSGISITPTADNTNKYFQFNSVQISATRVNVQPNTSDGFNIKLSVGTSGDVLIGSVNLVVGQLEVSIPALNQRTVVVAGESQFSLPLVDNN